MILEAFAEFLHSRPELPAGEALKIWLLERLNNPPTTNVERVIHMEIALVGGHAPGSQSKSRETSVMAHEENFYAQFKGNSSSGSRLLTSLYEYSMSYEQQKWSRFVHKLKASDFGTF